ncbi:uncharacterized protein LOC144158485 isoform X4 [Haemaphysalis longicornis]
MVQTFWQNSVLTPPRPADTLAKQGHLQNRRRLLLRSPLLQQCPVLWLRPLAQTVSPLTLLLQKPWMWPWMSLRVHLLLKHNRSAAVPLAVKVA